MGSREKWFVSVFVTAEGQLRYRPSYVKYSSLFGPPPKKWRCPKTFLSFEEAKALLNKLQSTGLPLDMEA